jgi:hypothetical protein
VPCRAIVWRQTIPSRFTAYQRAGCARCQVYTLLEEKKGLALLGDALLEVATHEILPFGATLLTSMVHEGVL